MENKAQFQKIKQILSQDGPNEAIADIPRLQELGEAMTLHGTQLALAILIIGLLVVKWLDKGLAFGFDYNALFQSATDSLGDDTAAGGVLRMFGRWRLVGKTSGNTGSLVYKVENRHRLGTDIAPQDLGFEVGYVGLTAVPFSDIGWALTNLNWEQHFLGNRLAFVAGIVDTTDYVDVYALVDPWNDFANLAFSTNPSIPAPN
jgi:porin